MVADMLSRLPRHAAERPAAAAVEVAGETWTWRDFGRLVAAIRAALGAPAPGGTQPVTAVLAQRRVSAYAGIIAARLAGHCFVPLNATHATVRLADILAQSRATTLVTGTTGRDRVAAILDRLPPGHERPRLIEAADSLAEARPLPDAPFPDPLPFRAGDLAYILFTSGSTGRPKGVPVSAAALAAYLAAVEELLEMWPGDRLSQTFDLSFDLSMHDLFVGLTRGATLVVPSAADLKVPAAWLDRAALTHWFSVPTLAAQMRAQGGLRPGAFPGLRSVLFCGEALPADLAAAFARAAPNAAVENWYGPTEATIACLRHPVAAADPAEPEVPIGRPFPGMRAVIAGPDGHPCADGEEGELCLIGPQLAEGYLDDPERTGRSFVAIGGERAYRTGDRARRGADGAIRFLGRADGQIKLRGYRIELAGIEHVLRRVSGASNAVAGVLPSADGSGTLVAAIEAAMAPDAIAAALAAMQAELPAYMVPAVIEPFDAFPLNASGKTDRSAILAEIAARDAARRRGHAAAAGVAGTVLAAALAVRPGLTPEALRSAPSLLDLGLTSLEFVGFTLELERAFGIVFTPEEVAALADLPLAGIIARIRARAEPPRRGLARWLGRLVPWARAAGRSGAGDEDDAIARSPRMNRALDFLAALPAIAGQDDGPLVLAIGSSGTMRAFDPEAFEAAARAAGLTCRAYNIGLPAVSVEGLARICRHIAGVLDGAGRRPVHVLWEFDPLHVIDRNGAGEAALPEAAFDGRIGRPASAALRPEFRWDQAARGRIDYAPDAARERRSSGWLGDREARILRAYGGQEPPVPAKLAAWREGLDTLAALAGRVSVFVHPLDAARARALSRDGSLCIDLPLAALTQGTTAALLDPGSFRLEPEDFLDLNHVNAVRGCARITRQIAQMMLTPPAA